MCKSELRDGEEEEEDQAGEVVGAVGADVEVADDDAAEGEADVSGDEEDAGFGWGEGAGGDAVDGRVEEDGPAGGHEAYGGEAREEVAFVGEDGDRDDGVGGPVGFDEGEEGEAEEGEDYGGGGDVGGGEAVEEEDHAAD